MNTFLQAVIDFADAAHGSQLRRYTPDRYIVHPVRVMKLCNEYTNDETILAAAILHDVVEDTPITPSDILEFLRKHTEENKSQRITSLVIELTDVYVKKSFPELNRAKRKSKEADRLSKCSDEAQTIKYADIIDNIGDMVDYDPDFCDRYLREAEVFLLKMKNGNASLRERALKAIEDGVYRIRNMRRN